MSQKRVNTGRVTKSQKLKILELMQSNKRIACGQFSGPNSATGNQIFWKNAADELNACGGACKNSDQWKKCWIDWKANVKKQQCAYNRFQKQTGNPPAMQGPRPVEGIDAEVLQFFAPDVTDGDGVTGESGLNETTTSNATDCVIEEVEYLDDFQPQATDEIDYTTIEVLPEKISASRRTKPPTYASALEAANKLSAEQHAEQMQLLNAILKCVQNIESKLK